VFIPLIPVPNDCISEVLRDLKDERRRFRLVAKATERAIDRSTSEIAKLFRWRCLQLFQ